MNRYKVLILISFIIVILNAGCQKQENDWQGTMEVVEGVTRVNNPMEPMYDATVFSISEEISIGEVQGPEEYMFSDAVGLAVGDDENIFVVDAIEGYVKVYDRKGTFFKNIGKKGQGPGEMQSPQRIQITPQNELMVRDFQADRMVFFTMEGDFLRNVSTAGIRNLSTPTIDSKGNIIGSFSIPGNSFRTELSKFNPQLEPIFTISNVELFELPVMKAFFSQHYWVVTEYDEIYWGISTEYKIHVIDSEGVLLREISKEYTPVKITEADKKERLKFLFGGDTIPPGVKLEWPENHWAFINMSLDESGRMFLQTFEKTSAGKNYFYDVFDKDGKYIVKIPLPSKPEVWKNGKLYTIEQDENGYQSVKRYDVRWGQLDRG